MSVVARSNYREIIITGDNTGRMKVFKYPSSTNMVTYDFRVFNLYTFKISPFGFWAYIVKSACVLLLLIIFCQKLFEKFVIKLHIIFATLSDKIRKKYRHFCVKICGKYGGNFPHKSLHKFSSKGHKRHM